MGQGKSKSSKIGSASGNSENQIPHGVYSSSYVDKKPETQQAGTGKDIMISYSHQDIEFMRKLQQLLNESKLTVWVDETGLTPGAAYLREIGEAIVDSACFLTVLSRDSIQSKYVQDEVSLAYISNKTIFAVALQPYDELSSEMDLGMKLTLACVQWHFIDLNGDIEEQLKPLLTSISAALASMKQEVEVTNVSDNETEEEDDDADHTHVMNRQAFQYRKLDRQMSVTSLSDAPTNQSGRVSPNANDFWKVHFGDEIQVPWTKFEELLITEYRKTWDDLGVLETDRDKLLKRVSKELLITPKGLINYRSYKIFCTKENELIPFIDTLKLFAAEVNAMQNVFSMSSSVRLSAISNLGKYQSKAVIDALLDLLEEADQDVQVVAAISLAHASSGIRAFKRRAATALLECLDSEDRLVRESGCLALGRIKSKRAVSKLVQLWRNDTISSVREAAQIAIGQIGGEEADQALHVTKVLSDEIQLLKA